MEPKQLVTMDAEAYKHLHEVIEKGDIKLVKRVLQDCPGEQYFSYEDNSAVYKAFSCSEYEIASHLIHTGARIHDSEVEDLYRLEIDLTRVNYLLLQYNRRAEKSCIFQLMSWSQSPQGLDGERLSAIVSLYEEFFKSEIIRMLMKVLEGENFDLVYDFSSEDVNRVYRLYEEECEVFGLTLSKAKEIFIGAKNLLSVDPRKRARVYGVVAEELCHLTLTILFENNAKPFREEDSKLNQEFWDIVLAVRTSLLSSCHVESVIEDVFLNYEYFDWACELIARVPHVVGIYGEEFGRRVFLETPELSNLLLFYDKNVLQKCKEYTDPLLNTKPQRIMDRLMKKDNFFLFKEKQIQPLKECFPSFRDHLVDEDGISVVTTNCIKLCMLQIYHELKREYKDMLDKKCLFFSRKCFEMKRRQILEALKGKFWEYLILMLDEKEMNLWKFTAEYLDHFDEFKNEGMRIVFVLGCQSLSQKFQSKACNYKWDDLTEEYKYSKQIITYIFKGEEESVYVPKECFSKVFCEEDIMRIIGGEVIEICDGEHLYSQGYIPETYIERKFQVMTVDRNVFKNLPSNTNIFLSGSSKREFQDLYVDEKVVQFLKGPEDTIQGDKSIFVVSGKEAMTFRDFEGMNSGKTNVWLHHDSEEYYLMNSDSSGDVFKTHLKQMILSEKEMLDFLKRKRVVVICDNAGYGKSTVISSLVGGVKENVPHSWLWRVDFNKFLTKDEDSLSLGHITDKSEEEEVIQHLILMLGIGNSLERYLFRKSSGYGHCFIFFDGFDEIPLKYKTSALKLLSTLRENTAVNLIVASRKHHQLELEQMLNTYSHQLVPFSREDQGRYLEKLWWDKLKYPYGKGAQAYLRNRKKVPEKIKNIIQELNIERVESVPEYKELILALKRIELKNSLESVRCDIEKVKFTSLAEHILSKTLLDEDSVEFMGIPLHLYMVGTIHLNGNFNVEIKSDMYCLSSDFIEQKILIYLEEKQELKEGPFKDKYLVKVREDVYRIHIKLAEQLIDEGEVYLDSNMDEEDLELCSALGIVFIHGKEVHFLHQTIAEFFLAESVRQRLHKKVLIKVLCDSMYKQVVIFLSSAVEKIKFPKEILCDVGFLINIMLTIVDRHSAPTLYALDSHMLYVFKIVKKLLVTFERMAQPALVNKFIAEIELRLILPKFHYVGGCLSVHMINTLLARNFTANRIIILNFVRYLETPQDIIDVLKECISLKITTKRGKQRKKDKVNQKRVAEVQCVQDLLSLKDSNGFGILFHALCSKMTENFAYLLMSFRYVLGKEQFIEAVVQSNEYRRELCALISSVELERTCCLFRDLHSLFGNEMDILFDDNIKQRLINSALYADIRYKSGGFRKVINLLIQCFGIKKLKELLLKNNINGDYLIHKFLDRNSCEFLMERLMFMENIFADKDWMNEFLKIKDSNFGNIFHLAAFRDMHLGELLRFCEAHLEKDEIKEMFLKTDEGGVVNGYNVMHFLFVENSFETLKNNVLIIKDILGDDQWFKQLLKSKSGSSLNIFHFEAENYDEIKPSFIDSYLHVSEIAELLTERDKVGQTCLHVAALINLRNLPPLLDYADKMLMFDRIRFEELIMRRDVSGNTFLHYLGKCYWFHNVIHFGNEVLNSLRKKLSMDQIERLLKIRNEEGQTFLQSRGIIRNKIIKCCEEIFGKDLIEELL